MHPWNQLPTLPWKAQINIYIYLNISNSMIMVKKPIIWACIWKQISTSAKLILSNLVMYWSIQKISDLYLQGGRAKTSRPDGDGRSESYYQNCERLCWKDLSVKNMVVRYRNFWHDHYKFSISYYYCSYNKISLNVFTFPRSWILTSCIYCHFQSKVCWIKNYLVQNQKI